MGLKIREQYSLFDRVKLLGRLLFVLFVVIGLFCVTRYYEKGEYVRTSTIERFLEIALEPVGSTMYIWGGGWNEEDSEAGATSTQLGLHPQWKTFAQKQDETYDFKQHRFERENGLDCSGYVGWVIYNTFETESGQTGYVTTSTDFAESLASRGWGKLIQNPKEFLPGDVVSMEGHVWICLGTCTDGSVLLVHSSPPGVSVCGTQIGEGKSSIAIEVATRFMSEQHSNWQEKYPNRTVSTSYLENVSVFRWNKSTMLDAEKVQNMSGEEIIVYMMEVAYEKGKTNCYQCSHGYCLYFNYCGKCNCTLGS